MNWLLSNARIDDSDALFHLILENQVIKACISAQEKVNDCEYQHWDLAGKVILPGLVEAHSHLDKTYSPVANPSGTLIDAIEAMQLQQRQRNFARLKQNAERGIRQAISMGVSYLRSHLDIASEADLGAVDVMLELREEYASRIHIEFAALTDTSTIRGSELVAKALDRGVDIIGGAPAFSHSPELAIQNALALAQRTGCGIDLHLDENNDPESRALEYLADLIIEQEWPGLVCASHCCSLSFMGESDRHRIMDKVARAGIHVITLPTCNLVLIGREQQPKPRGATPVKELLAAGVNVAAGSDNVQDPFNPFGNYDPLASAQINAQVAQMTSKSELLGSLAMVMRNAASALAVPDYGIHAGAPAHLTVLHSQDYLSAITSPPLRCATFFNGEPVVKTQIEQHWLQETGTEAYV